jgi:hypothetical protein
MDQLQERGRIETLIQSLSRFSEKVLLILSGRSDVEAFAKKVGPALIFERLWRELGIKKVTRGLLSGRRFEFDVVFKLAPVCQQAGVRQEKRWKRIKGYKLLPHVIKGVRFVDGKMEEKEIEVA